MEHSGVLKYFYTHLDALYTKFFRPPVLLIRLEMDIEN